MEVLERSISRGFTLYICPCSVPWGTDKRFNTYKRNMACFGFIRSFYRG